MSPAAEIRGMSIVLLGDFNPKIFQPSWFGAHELIRPTEADEADVEIVHPEVAEFRLDWVRLQVTRERFAVDTSQDAFFEASRDLVLGTFELLRHTPLRAMGINTHEHRRMNSTAAWREFSRALAPHGPWQGLLTEPEMEDLTIQGVRPDGYKGCVQVTVQPSQRIADGIYLRVNDHYAVIEESAADPPGPSVAMQILRENWQSSRERSFGILERLVKNSEI
jgi:hypothetical protein